MKKLNAVQYLELFNTNDIKKSSLPYTKGMSKPDAEKYLLEIAAHSMEITPELTKGELCTCGNDMHGVIDKLHVNKHELFYDLGEVKLQFKYPQFHSTETDPIAQLLSCIDYAVIADIKKSNESIDFDDMSMISEHLTFEVVQDILRSLDTEIYSVVEFVCSNCGATDSEVISGFDNLLEYYKE